MDRDSILEILRGVEAGNVTAEEAALLLRAQPYHDLGYAKPDHHRALRQGIPEVIYGAGKTPKQIIGISRDMLEAGQKRVLITRLTRDAYEEVAAELDIEYFDYARIALIGGLPEQRVGKIAVITGGTSDIPVAEESAITAEALGNNVQRIYDVGVAGLHRLLGSLEELQSARVVVAIAGMEGALASVAGGLVDCPVIGVPTSVGYGASFGGISALLSMLNSCASGVSVVNIDNGFGAGYLAGMINQIGE